MFVPAWLQIVCRVITVFLVAWLVYWLGVQHGLRHPGIEIPKRPSGCPWCGGSLRSELVWSSVCRACNRGQVGPFDTKATSGIHLGWDPDKPKPAPPFVSHVDVATRHASDSPGGYPWKGL